MIETQPFGSTGHQGTRTIFGAAALGRVSQDTADGIMRTLLDFGVNHIDTAAGYGDSELRLAPWMASHRDRFFLATKTRERTYEAARDGIQHSLERLGVTRLDLIQLHNLVEPDEWETAMGPGGALEAALDARDRGLVRFIGVTGHGTRVAEMHLRSLERHPFDSVLLPYNYTMMQQPEYAADFEELYRTCQQRGIAMQTIKSIARRRWQDGDESPRFSWYEPLQDEGAIQRAVSFVLARPGVFLNTSSDANLLRTTLEAASTASEPVASADIESDIARHEMQPLFVRGVTDRI